jgi:SAM-dependent methyltransferase
VTGSLSGLRASYQATAGAWDGEATYGPLAAALVAATPVRLVGSTVLDLGAGTGVAARAARSRGAGQVVAIDLADSMLRTGGLTGAAVVGDVGTLPFADHSFDLAVAACCLNHLPDPRAALQEVRRVASAVVASAFRAGWTHPAKSVVESQAADLGYVAPAWYVHFKAEVEPRTATPEAMQSVARAAGWPEVTASTVDVSTAVSDPAGLVRWRLGMAHVAPWVAGLPEDVRAELVRRCERALVGAPLLVVPLVVLVAH